jgi:hypothetical protein
VDLTQPFNVKRPTREFRGGLQTETVTSFTSTTDNATLFDRIKAQARSVTSALFNPTNNTANYYVRPEDELFYKIPLELDWTRVGNSSVYQGTDSTVTGTRRYGVQSRVSRGNKNKLGTNNIDSTKDTAPATFREQFLKFATQREKPIRGSKTFKELENTLQTNGYFSGVPLDAQNIGPYVDNTQIIAGNVPGTNFKYPNVLDPYNGEEIKSSAATVVEVDGNRVSAETQRQINEPSALRMYGNIEFDPKNIDVYADTNKTDIIKFVFRRAARDAQPVHFRAFLSSLKENVKPEFNEQRYIGRTERFVTYGGAKRTANFEFNIVAFGSTETDRVWERINYLTGMAFPVKASDNGFMVPPLFKLTIGGIYEEQPCYIETLDYDFLDNTITFDIDKEVSQVVNVKMNVVLLEKRSKFYDSPFYAITEKREQQLLRANST